MIDEQEDRVCILNEHSLTFIPACSVGRDAAAGLPSIRSSSSAAHFIAHHLIRA